MRKHLISIIIIFLIILASAFVFKDPHDNNVKLAASGFDNISAEQNQFGLTEEQKQIIKDNWQALKDSWSEIKAQLQDTPLYDFFENFQNNNSSNSFTANEFRSEIDAAFSGLPF